MESLQRGKITHLYGLDDFRENDAVEAVREKSSMIEHVDPDLTVVDCFGRRRLPEDFARGHRRDEKARALEEFAGRLPSQLEAVLKAVDGALLFQLI